MNFPWSNNGPFQSVDSSTKSWEEMFAELLAFRIRFQSFNVSPSQNVELHGWMTEQRQMFQSYLQAVDESKLTEKRIRKLQEIGFPWEDVE